jgi:hypothetical protein
MVESLHEAIEVHQPFRQNKYLNWYLNLVSKEYDDEYTEKHHILPKSLFPEYKTCSWNLIRLNARAHFIAHLLLPKILKELEHERKMLWAVNRFRAKGKYFNSRLYKKVKLRISEVGISAEQVERVAAKRRGKKHSEEHKNKISESLKSKKIVRGPMTEEHKRKMIESKKRNHVDKIWMHKDGIQTKVRLEEVDKYMMDGWEKGTKRTHVTEEYRQKFKKYATKQWQKVKETGHTGHLIKV